MINSILNSNVGIIVALFLGILTGYCDNVFFNQVALTISQIFINLLKLISAPIIFLSIFSAVSGMINIEEFKSIGKKLIKYTFLTTYIAATVALVLYILFDPAHVLNVKQFSEAPLGVEKGYINYIIQIVPSNIISPFSENQVISVLFLAILFSVASLGLQKQQRLVLHNFFSSLNALIVKVASWIVRLIPVAIWSFIVLLVKDMQEGLKIAEIALYLLTIVSANLIQGVVILPLFAKAKGVSPVKLFFNMLPALTLAFFSKSSSATLPMTMRCAEERAGMPKKLSNLAFPLCTAINMNGCAAFILVTVLFVSMNHGIQFSIVEMFLWTFIATIAAVGNAGVPMGCYFLSSAFLASQDIPLNLLAVILPFYAIIDMLETTINVWSDSCVVAVVERETITEPREEEQEHDQSSFVSPNN